jgi:pro-apoptotic serine protease NMA111
MKLAVRRGYSETWDKTIFAEPLPPTPPTPLSGSFSTPEILRYPGEREIPKSQIMVHFITPIQLDGALFCENSGSGIIFDAKRGYAIISSSVVFQDLGNVSIIIADLIIIDGEIVLIHQ